MRTRSSRGFTLVELAIVLVIMGLLLMFSIPAYQKFTASTNATGAANNVAAQFRLAREKAIDTGAPQTLVFHGGATYSARQGGTTVASWTLPHDVAFRWAAGTDSTYTFGTDGRSDRSGLVILQNSRGFRDTVSVQMSGLVTSQ